MSQRIALLLATCGAVLSACGAKTTPINTNSAPVDTLCEAGKFQCIGNAQAECGTGGKSLIVTSCKADKFCNPASGKCELIVCTEKSSMICAGSDTTEVCSDDGSKKTIKTCTSKEKCMAGLCVPSACGGSQKRCGWKALLTCTGSAWKKDDCKENEYCDETTLACTPMACPVGAVECKDPSTARQCSAKGVAWVEQACGDNAGCFDGVCHALVAGTTVVDDAASAGADADGGSAAETTSDVAKDAKPLMDLPAKDLQMDKLNVFDVIISQAKTAPDGTEPTHFSDASAAWLDGLGTLQITAINGLAKLEIQVAKIEEFAKGSYSAVGGEAPDSRVGYNDGVFDSSTLGGNKFQYEAADYEISITEFGDMGGRIKGTVSAQLTSAVDGSKLWLIDGKFDIKR